MDRELGEATEGKMFEQLLGRLIGGGLGDAATDAFSSAAIDVLVEQLTPLVYAARLKVLERVAGDPPATFRVELAAAGLNVTDVQALALWQATFRAIAAERAPRPQLSLVPPPAEEEGATA